MEGKRAPEANPAGRAWRGSGERRTGGETGAHGERALGPELAPDVPGRAEENAARERGDAPVRSRAGAPARWDHPWAAARPDAPRGAPRAEARWAGRGASGGAVVGVTREGGRCAGRDRSRSSRAQRRRDPDPDRDPVRDGPRPRPRPPRPRPRPRPPDPGAPAPSTRRAERRPRRRATRGGATRARTPRGPQTWRCPASAPCPASRAPARARRAPRARSPAALPRP